MPGTRSRFAFKPVDLIAVSVGFLLVVGVAAWIFVPDLVRVRGYETREGLVTSVDRDDGEVVVRFVFLVRGIAKEGTDRVGERALDAYVDGKLEPGDKIEVRYPRDRPDLAVTELSTRGSTMGLIASVATAAALAVLVLVLVHRRRGRHGPPAAHAAAGLVRCADGHLVVGGSRRRASRLELDAHGIIIRDRNGRRRIRWEAISGVDVLPRRGPAGLFASHDLRIDHDGSQVELALRPEPGRPLPRAADFEAVAALISFCVAYAEARGGLSLPDSVAAFVDELRRAIERTRPQPAAARRWPQARPEQRAALDRAMAKMCAASGVELFGGRTIRGHRLEADPTVVSAARAWVPRGLEPGPSDDVVGAAIDAVQGPRPSWPLDALLGGSEGGA